MTEKMRKGLEEAAKKNIPDASDEDNIMPAREGYLVKLHRKIFLAGAELGYKEGAECGYKEAIEQAKEWLYEHGKLDKLDIVEFDMDMNKLWEEKK